MRVDLSTVGGERKRTERETAVEVAARRSGDVWRRGCLLTGPSLIRTHGRLPVSVGHDDRSSSFATGGQLHHRRVEKVSYLDLYLSQY